MQKRMIHQVQLNVSDDGTLQVELVNADITLTASDLNIGAMELKDADTENRADIDAAGALLVRADSWPLPAAAATAAHQATQNTALGSIVTNTTGLATAIAQAAGNLSLETIASALAGAATAAKQDTGNASLAAINAKIPALETGRIPVVLPAGGSGLTDSELRASDVSVSAPALEQVQGADSTDVAGPMVLAVVSDTPQSYQNDELRPLSMTSDGRLRVSMVPAATYLDFFTPFDFGRPDNLWATSGNPWGL